MAAKKKSKKKAKSTPRKKTLRSTSKRKTNIRTPKRKTRKRTVRAKGASKRGSNQRSKRRAASRTQDRTYPVGKQEPFENQSGDLQGLSTTEDVDSESIDELAGEGNAFEADVLQGVEDAENDAEHEVRTHEVPEDDVPSEYQDEE